MLRYVYRSLLRLGLWPNVAFPPVFPQRGKVRGGLLCKRRRSGRHEVFVFKTSVEGNHLAFIYLWPSIPSEQSSSRPSFPGPTKDHILSSIPRDHNPSPANPTAPIFQLFGLRISSILLREPPSRSCKTQSPNCGPLLEHKTQINTISIGMTSCSD